MSWGGNSSRYWAYNRSQRCFFLSAEVRSGYPTMVWSGRGLKWKATWTRQSETWADLTKASRLNRRVLLKPLTWCHRWCPTSAASREEVSSATDTRERAWEEDVEWQQAILSNTILWFSSIPPMLRQAVMRWNSPTTGWKAHHPARRQAPSVFPYI